MSDPKLKPCPFCGDEVVWCYVNEPTGTHDHHICTDIHCNGCGMHVANTDFDDEDIEVVRQQVADVWNTRVTIF